MKLPFVTFLIALGLAVVLGLTPSAFAEEASTPEAEAVSAPASPSAAEASEVLTATTCIASLLQQAELSRAPLLPQEPPAASGEGEEAPSFLAFPNPCVQAPPPPPSCVCGGCCERCRCWRGTHVAKCLTF